MTAEAPRPLLDCELCGKPVPLDANHFLRHHVPTVSVTVDYQTALYWRRFVCATCWVKVGKVLAALQEGIDNLTAQDPPSEGPRLKPPSSPSA